MNELNFSPPLCTYHSKHKTFVFEVGPTLYKCFVFDGDNNGFIIIIAVIFLRFNVKQVPCQ